MLSTFVRGDAVMQRGKVHDRAPFQYSAKMRFALDYLNRSAGQPV